MDYFKNLWNGLQKKIKKISRKKWIIAGICGGVLLLIFVIVGVVNQRAKNDSSTYQTAILSRGDLTAIVGATGTVNSEHSAVLRWQTSGQVENVNVQIGDLVTADQVLANLLSTSLPQSVILATSDLVNAQRNLDHLKLSSLAVAQAQQALVATQKAYDDAKSRIRSTDLVRGSKETRDKYYSQLLEAQKAYDAMVSYYQLFINQPDTDAGKAQAYAQLSSVQRSLDTAKANYDFVSGTYSITEVEQSAADFAVAKAKLEDAQREYDRLKNGPDPSDVAAAQARVDAIQATLSMAQQVAPFPGTITEAIPNVGDMVTAGLEAFRVDDLQNLRVDLQVNEIDIVGINSNQDATIVFDAIPDKEYHGKVSRVAMAGDVVQGVANFMVTVTLTDADENVLPGMTTAVNITTSQVKDVLIVPNRAVRVVNGAITIYLLRNGVVTPVSITLGASSDTDSEVVAGDLREGEVIILNPPTSIFPNGGGRNLFGG
jgi:HlyD family secretion protein